MSIAAKDANGSALVLNSVATPQGETPGSTLVDPATGAAFKGSSEAQLLALTAIAQAMQTALDAINGKTLTPSGGALPVSGPLTAAQLASSSLQLPTGAATEATLTQVRDAIKAQIDIASTVWTDNSGAYYVRRDLVNEGTGVITVSFTDATGTAATPGAGLKPLAMADRDVTQELFDATSAGTGYSSGDILGRVLIIDASPATPTVTALWVNLTTGATISAPTGGTYERANEAIGVRQVGSWSVGLTGSLPAFAATPTFNMGTVPADPFGANADAASATGSISAKLRQIATNTPALGAAAAAASSPVSVSTETANGSITTQNLVANGVATANSAVELALNGAASMAIQVTGTYTGALSVQVTLDGSRWETITGAIITNMLSGVGAATIASAAIGVFTVPVHGALRARVTGLAAMSGTAAVTLRSLASPTALYASQPTAANLQTTATISGNPVLGAGTNAIGDMGIQVRANATGAATVAKFTAAATNNAASTKASAGRVLGWHFYNTTASAKYFRFFNKASAPTMGTDSPAFVVVVPANSAVFNSVPAGIAFATGIAIACTGAVADLDNTATAANDVIGSFWYA